MPSAQQTAAGAEPALWREELKRAWAELRGSRSTPARAAAAVAIGLFIGSIPIYGLHTPLVLTICILLQLDGFVSWMCSHVSNPLFSFALIPGELMVGHYVIEGTMLPFGEASALVDAGLWGVAAWLGMGAIIVASCLAVIGAVTVYFGVKLKRRFRPATARAPYTLPEDAPPWWHAAERLASRYVPIYEDSTPAQRSRFHYVRVKTLSDPITKMVAELGDLGHVLDVGTGRGQIPLALLELGHATKVRGIDWDSTKIDAAIDAAAEPPALDATFEALDVRQAELRAADTVLMIDIVHYMAIDEQDALLGKAARAVAPGGSLVLREADMARGWRSWVTLAEEKLFTLLRFNRGARVKFRAAADIVARLEAEGLRCEVRPAWGATPFSNVLIIGRRPDAAA